VALEYVYSYNLDSQLPLPFTPPFQVKSNVLYEYKETYIGTYMRWAAPQKRTDRNEKATMDYTLFDLVAGKEWEHWTLSFQINNVFNRRYLNHLSVYRQLNLPEQGRNFVLSVKFHFESKKTINS
jgi:iron complex outermembrane receptor protein